MIQLSVTPATEPDIPAINRLVNSAYRGESSKKGWTTEADLLGGIRINEEGLRAMLQNPDVMILKYEEDDQLLGCVSLEQKGQNLYLGMLTVAPEAQANGIGKTLLFAAEKIAVEQRYRAITMTVITVRHELIAWYERRGYRLTGEKQPFPNDPCFGLPKQPLEFVVMEKSFRA